MLSKSRVRLMEPAVPIFDQLNYIEGIDRRHSERHALPVIGRLKYSLNKLFECGAVVLEPFKTMRNDSACISCQFPYGSNDIKSINSGY